MTREIDCISLMELYKKNGPELHYGGYIDFYRDGKSEYYDLRTKPYSDIICCDGEECEVIFNDDEAVLLSNLTKGNKFYLTKDEYNIAAFDMHLS